MTKEMDLKTAINARAVCKSWKRLTKEADLDPLEAGTSAEEQALGRQGQQHLEEALALEGQVWTPEHTAALSQHLNIQEEVSLAMLCYRVEWLPPAGVLHWNPTMIRCGSWQCIEPDVQGGVKS